MTSWAKHVERRARMLHDEIATWRVRARERGLDPDVACARFYDLLESIYTEDYPLAKARDSSDLLLHVEGRAVDNAPRVSLVSGLFNNVKFQVRDLTRAIAGLKPDTRLTVNDVDLGLSGLARGSLYLGFVVPLRGEIDGNVGLLGVEDPLYVATRDALRAINTVAHNIEVTDEDEATRHLSEVVSDPKIRDAALVAVRRIAPSGKQGVHRIEVSSSAEEGQRPGQLLHECALRLGACCISLS